MKDLEYQKHRQILRLAANGTHTFEEIVDLVEDYVKSGAGAWSDFKDAEEIQEKFGALLCRGKHVIAREFLNSLIKHDGKWVNCFCFVFEKLSIKERL